MNDNYTAASGETIYAGMVAPSDMTALETFIAAMSPNTWAEYSGTNINQMLPREFDSALMGILESDMNYVITNWANKFSWSSENKIICGVGTAQGFNIAGGDKYSKHVVFDLLSDDFSVKWSPTGEIQGHIYDANCSGFVGDLTFRKALNATEIWSYNKASDTWQLTEYSLAGLPSFTQIWSIECSASHNALYCLENTTGRLVKFDMATGVRTVVGNHSGIGAYPLIIAVSDNIIFGGGGADGKLYKLTAAGVVSEILLSEAIDYAAAGNHRFLPHPTIADTVIVFSNDGIKTLNVNSGVITSVASYPAEPVLNSSVSASLIGLGAVATWRGRGRASGVTQSKFWIYKV